MATTETKYNVPPGAVITVGPSRVDRVASAVAIVRDVLLIIFMVAAMVVGLQVVSAVGSADNSPALPTSECIGEESC